jgi:hypothetical protein
LHHRGVRVVSAGLGKTLERALGGVFKFISINFS